jgi:hypothetical protein
MKSEYDFRKAKRGAVVSVPKGKTRITIRLDDEILAWFRDQVERAGVGNYQTVFNEVLRQDIQRVQEPLEKTLCRVIREEIREHPSLHPPYERDGEHVSDLPAALYVLMLCAAVAGLVWSIRFSLGTGFGRLGWIVQSREDVNLAVGRDVAIREFPMKPGFGLNKSVCHLHCCHLANLV